MTMTRRGNTGHLVTLTGAQAAGQAGTWAGLAAALPIVLGHPHPAVMLSAITAAWSIPSVAARLAGGLVDRYGPRLTGSASWGLAAVAAAAGVATRPTFLELLAILALLSIGGTWGISAGDAAPTWLPSRPDLAAAGSWLVIATSLPLAVGPLGATNLITYVGDRAAWGLVAGLSVAAALGSALVPATRPASTAAPGHRRQPESLATVKAALVATAGVYLTFGVVTVLEPLYVRQVLGAPLTVYGWLMAACAIGGVAVALVNARDSRFAKARLGVPVAALIVAAGEAVYVSTRVTALAFIGAVIFGVGAALFRLTARAVIVGSVPLREHGRALSLWESVQCACFVAPSAITGALVTAVGLRTVLAYCCVLAAGVAALTLTRGLAGSPRIERPMQALNDEPARYEHGRREAGRLG
jgi:MFS family permease